MTSSSGPVAHGSRPVRRARVAQGDPPGAALPRRPGLVVDGGPACRVATTTARDTVDCGHRRARGCQGGGRQRGLDSTQMEARLARWRAHPDAAPRQVRAYLRDRFPALEHAPLLAARSCRYELTPDTNFIADRHPASSERLAGGRGLRPWFQARAGDGRATRRRAARRGAVTGALRAWRAPAVEQPANGGFRRSVRLLAAQASRIRSREPETRKRSLNLPAASNPLARIRDAKTPVRAACAALGGRLRRPRALERFTSCLCQVCGRVATGGAGSRARLLIRGPEALPGAARDRALHRGGARRLPSLHVDRRRRDAVPAPSELAGRAGRSRSTGASWAATGDAHAGGMRFRLRDIEGGGKERYRRLQGLRARPVRSGATRRRREPRNGTFVATPGTMVTKCPSKYTAQAGRQ